MFEELIKSKRVDLAKNNLCDRYLFYNDWLYRPMWTYIAQKYGSEICFYFYSTNSEGFKTLNGYKDNDFDWRTISWQKYFVWDEYQENFIKKYAKLNPIFQIVGPTYFQSKIEINNNNYFSKDSITIFDITPFRPSYYMKLGLEHDYFNYQVAKEFLSDILVIAEHYNLKIYLKIKRKINLKYHDRSYYNFLDTLSCNKRVVFVDSDISPFHIIKKSSLCISYPFTSTALIAKYLNKPSCYYDPTSTIYKDDTGAHGVDIITNKEELLQWIGNYIYHK
jgi:polysaccharide biosynthesis PFTS motif protein